MPTSIPLDSDQVRLTAFVDTLHTLATGLTAALQRVAPTIQPVAAAALAYVDRPEVQATFSKALRIGSEMHERIEAVEAPGYTPYFEGLGCNGFEARLHAGLVRGLARRSFEDARNRRVALMALHDLAKRPRWHPALVRQVKRLGQHGGTLSFLDEAFRCAGCPEMKGELEGLLLSTRDGDTTCGPRTFAIVARIAPHLPSPRGRPVRFETVLHRTFLDWSGHLGGRQAYTYGPVPNTIRSKEDFTDPATAAARVELGRPRFSPVAARRSARKRRTNAKS